MWMPLYIPVSPLSKKKKIQAKMPQLKGKEYRFNPFATVRFGLKLHLITSS